MKTILYIVQKEFLQILRNKFLSRAIILIPIIQMLVLVYAATFEMKSIKISFVDQDKSTRSVELMQKFYASPFFKIQGLTDNIEKAKEELTRNDADVVCIIPPKFSHDLVTMQSANIQILLNSINASSAELSLAYCNAVIMSYSASIAPHETYVGVMPPSINVQTRHWYNADLNYKIYMAPGILVILVTVIGWLLAGMNLVSEKEKGTIEQLNVTPIKKYQFIIGKLIPFLIIGLIDLSFGMIIAHFLFKMPVEGSLITLFVFAAIYLITVLGIGLLISTISQTQQQVLFVSFFFVMVFIIMSGLFTALENMPVWGQKLDIINPAAYFIRVIRMVLLKGSGFANISKELITISVYAVIINSLAIWRYRKTV
jgi:ABC-2 type transport system permease protein